MNKSACIAQDLDLCQGIFLQEANGENADDKDSVTHLHLQSQNHWHRKHQDRELINNIDDTDCRKGGFVVPACTIGGLKVPIHPDRVAEQQFDKYSQKHPGDSQGHDGYSSELAPTGKEDAHKHKNNAYLDEAQRSDI